MDLMVDGGPDENPRFPKTLRFAAQHFKANNLDAIFIVTHAPYQSASNPIERRMAPLSRDLCGLVLPHDYYGNHLNSSGRTVDEALEISNFKKAGSLLAEVWSQRTIDNYEVKAEYISPRESGSGTEGTDSTYVTEQDPEFLTEMWKYKHVRQSQYLLRVSHFTITGITRYLKGQFLPAPVKFKHVPSGIAACGLHEDNGSFLDLSSRICLQFMIPEILPFDFYGPTLSSKIEEQCCDDCGNYFVTKKALLAHKKIHQAMVIDEEMHEDIEIDEVHIIQPSSNIPEFVNIENVADWLQIPFENDVVGLSYDKNDNSK